MKPKFLPSPSAWHAWLEEHDELWVGFHKVDSDNANITWREAVDGALCFGFGLRGVEQAFRPALKSLYWAASAAEVLHGNPRNQAKL